MKIIFFDSKSYDKESFTKELVNYPDIEVKFLKTELTPFTAELAHGYDAVCAFVSADSIPDMRMPVFFPEKILFSLFRAMGVKRLGAIVPKPEQIAASEAYYSEFSPRIRAASPYGPREQIEAAAASFRNSDVDILMTDCMGFTEEAGKMIQAASGKQVFVPRVVVPALLKAIVS